MSSPISGSNPQAQLSQIQSEGMANIKIQEASQKIQEALAMISNLLKKKNECNMAIINNCR
jgi:hypothetical protein